MSGLRHVSQMSVTFLKWHPHLRNPGTATGQYRLLLAAATTPTAGAAAYSVLFLEQSNMTHLQSQS